MTKSKEAKARAEALFKQKQDQAHHGARAWEEQDQRRRALSENMQRLKALRLAKEAATAAPKSKKKRSTIR